jgi:predicted nucleic acid-binding protein
LSRRGPGLDTSVVLRLLTGEPKDQALAAAEFFTDLVDKGIRPCVSDQVISETYFALCYHYEAPKPEALKALAAFVNGGEVVCLGVSGEILKQANLAKPSPGFVDRVIHAQYLASGAGMVTFEKSAAKLPDVTLLGKKPAGR